MNDTRPFGTFAPTGLTRWVIDRTRGLPGSWVGRRIAMMLRRVVMRKLKGQPLDLETFGVRMRVVPDKNVCERRIIFTPQYFDLDEIKLIAARNREGFTFIDVGSNVGWYALLVARKVNPSSRILAVEPQPEIFDRLVHNIRLNPFGTIKAVDCAIADKTGELTLFLDPRNKGEASLKIVNSSQTDTIRVPAVTLLDLIRREGFTHVDAVKLDVEGAEDLILDPFFRDAPAALHPSLFIIPDVPDRWQVDLPKLLQEKGYRQTLRTRMNLVFERTR
ncbi:FkbM family methyltransferase [Microvirga guangxiensis]|uniref:Methyltransferase, FkbM family n=1 Tax=Microvirga guangxiensis TaxID=549386 RepID=A0A1G5LGJ8_9HYPH|nr:FkbM family methyltransferase [Microvirga guangxiensis]SCZ11370.1 methyltransferase, FkbM family [Microvirga guangxiensis]